MKIRVALVIDVDPQDLNESGLFGANFDGSGQYDAAELRADVRSYVLALVQGSSLADETDAEVTAR
jgi:hypothetical protein